MCCENEQTENPRLANQAIKGTRMESPRMAQSAGTGPRRQRVIYWHCDRVKRAYAEIQRRTKEGWGLK